MKRPIVKKLLIAVGLILVVLGIYFRSPKVLVENADVTVTPSPTPSVTLPKEEAINGYGEISEEGTNTNFEMIIGDKVTGTLTGFCEGTLEGSFDSRTGFIQGLMKGSCQKLPATGRFEGEIDLAEKTGSGTYEGKTLIFTRSGFWTLEIR